MFFQTTSEAMNFFLYFQQCDIKICLNTAGETRKNVVCNWKECFSILLLSEKHSSFPPEHCVDCSRQTWLWQAWKCRCRLKHKIRPGNERFEDSPLWTCFAHSGGKEVDVDKRTVQTWKIGESAWFHIVRRVTISERGAFKMSKSLQQSRCFGLENCLAGKLGIRVSLRVAFQLIPFLWGLKPNCLISYMEPPLILAGYAAQHSSSRRSKRYGVRQAG